MKFIFSLIAWLIVGGIPLVRAQVPAPSPSSSSPPYSAYVSQCVPQPYTPVDDSGEGLPIAIDNSTGSGVNNSSYCWLPGGMIYFQALVMMPTTPDTHQARLSLPVSGPLYDMPISALTTGCSVSPVYANVTPGHYVKFFGMGSAGALTYAQLSGCLVGFGGIYYGFSF